jgi:hypothetical protein
VNGFSAAVSSASRAIGRYFSIVSFIPSFFLTSFVLALTESGAWASGSLDWTRSGKSFTNLETLALLVLISMAFGIAVHPIQFAVVQFFEGHWGASRLAKRARIARILHHYNQLTLLNKSSGEADLAIQKAEDTKTRLKPTDKIQLLSIRDEGERLAAEYPEEKDDLMPTRLGNVLRRYERLAGSQYGLDAVDILPLVALVAHKERVEYLSDQRETLDLSVRMCATSLLAAVIAVAALWRHGPWFLLALLPYGIAYLSYRGAVVVAHEYGSAMSTIIDLDRFELYKQLRIPMPASTSAEQATNERLMELLRHNPNADLRYSHPFATTGGDRDRKAT